MIVEQQISIQSFVWISMLNAGTRWCKQEACSPTERRKLSVCLTQFLCEWRPSPWVEQMLGKRIETFRLSIVAAVSFIAFPSNAENEFKKFPFLSFSPNKQFISASCVHSMSSVNCLSFSSKLCDDENGNIAAADKLGLRFSLRLKFRGI